MMLVYGTGKRGDMREVQILDILLSSSGRDAVKEVKKAIDRIISKEAPDWITFAASRGFPFISALKKNGFFPVPRSASLVCRLAPGSMLPDLHSDNIGIVLGDLDTF